MARHASATKVNIYLVEKDASIVLIVEDNGRGITRSEIFNPKSLGLLGMRERALVFGGKVKIKGAPGKRNNGHVKNTYTEMDFRFSICDFRFVILEFKYRN